MKISQIRGVQELSKEELKKIEGGKNIIEYAAEGLGWLAGKIHNAWDEFKAGWNSVDCGC